MTGVKSSNVITRILHNLVNESVLGVGLGLETSKPRLLPQTKTSSNIWSRDRDSYKLESSALKPTYWS